MRLIIINIFMAIASLLMGGFGYWTYNQSVYNNNVKNYFQEKHVTSLDNLSTIASLSDRLVIVKGQIVADETFLATNGQKSVLERIEEEMPDARKGWKEVKEGRVFRIVPFWLKDKSEKVLVDPYGLDKTFLGKPEIKNDNSGEKPKRISQWTFVPGQTVHILGNIENKGGQLIINNPNLYKTAFNPFGIKEPFIITEMSVFEITNKAREISEKVYNVSLALFAIGVFFLFTSIGNILKTYKKLQNNNDFN